MPFKAAFAYNGAIYQIEFTPHAEVGHMGYRVRIGSELSLAIKDVDLIPTGDPGPGGFLWISSPGKDSQWPFSPDFIQAIGHAIEKHDE